MQKPLPTFEIETRFQTSGYRTIAGIDEAGRGALAGPLIAAAVVLDPETADDLTLIVRDSKTLSARQRSRAFDQILERARGVGLGIVMVDEIDRFGISAANRIAFERAVFALPEEPDCLLCDAFLLDHPAPQMGLIDGDALSLSIAAASIVAKVSRDRCMQTLHDRFPFYGFARHAGYGTAAHLQALSEHGSCPEHRQSFAPVRAVSERPRR